MNNNLLLKCLIAFVIGIIVYKFISDRCSCNIIEGQETDGVTDEITDEVTDEAINEVTAGSNDSLNQDIIINNELQLNNLQELLNKLAQISGTQQNENILDNISSLSDIGDSVNIETLDYIELIVRNMLEVDNQTLKQRISATFFDGQDTNTICLKDINLNIMTFMILIHNNIINKDEFVNVINISDRLSKYVPDLFNKLEELYEDCPKNSNYYKSQILSSVFNKLFKNNTTVINVKGFSNLMKSLENVKTIYIVLFMICFTYIAVKFMGMFNMKLNM